MAAGPVAGSGAWAWHGSVLPLSAGAAQGPTLRGTQEASIWAGVGCPVKILNKENELFIMQFTLTFWQFDLKITFFFPITKKTIY